MGLKFWGVASMVMVLGEDSVMMIYKIGNCYRSGYKKVVLQKWL
jgi:hypothetical protein